MQKYFSKYSISSPLINSQIAHSLIAWLKYMWNQVLSAKRNFLASNILAAFFLPLINDNKSKETTKRFQMKYRRLQAANTTTLLQYVHPYSVRGAIVCECVRELLTISR